jgi:hypothetical protein
MTKLHWRTGEKGIREATHGRAFYRIEIENGKHVVIADDKVIAMSTNPEIAQEMAERHAETGFTFPYPPPIKY